LPLIVVTALVVWAAFTLDTDMIRWVALHQFQSLKNVAGLISQYGDWPDFMVAGVVCTALLLALRRQRLARIVCIMMISTTLAGGIANSVRVVSGRPRPNAGLVDGWYGIRHNGKWLIGSNKYHSFPSGHTTTAFAFFLPLLLLCGVRVGALGLVYACMVASSRIYLAVHHLSDITVAVLIATVVAVLVCRWLSPLLLPQEA
jgi:undecaprenyl-diphosphatase